MRKTEDLVPGPDLYTLLALVELEVALLAGGAVDAAHALVSDLAARAFGPRMFDSLAEALAAEGAPDDLARLLSDEDLARRVLQRLRADTGEDDEAPELVWSAFGPEDPSGGRTRMRRAAQQGSARQREALLRPCRRRVAGESRR